MKRFSVTKILICLIVITLLATGCFGKTKLHENFNEQDMIVLAETVINEVHVNGVEKVINDRMRDDYKAEYPVDDMEEDFDSLRTGLGAFIAYTDTTIVGKNSPDDKAEPFCVVCITGTYEKGELVFFLTFDIDMNLVGFFAKK